MNEQHATPKKVHIETWGCQMNAADSETMLAMLAERNYSLTENVDEADLVLLNTCHIREKARHKVLSRLGVLKELKAQKPGMTIAVSGCVAQAEGQKLLKAAPQIDVLFGPGKINELPSLLEERSRTGKAALAIGFKREHEEPKPIKAPPTLTGKREISRFVNIQQGCNNYCTFCVVPYTRGREVSRPPQDIVAEVKAMVAGGAKEITLLGQNVNSYGNDLTDSDNLFVKLLSEAARVEGLDRLRFTTSNPHDLSKDLADLFRSEPKLGRYMHLPVQSGSDTILDRMKRKVTRAEYLERVSWLRAAVPDMALSTDLIVGFPGETEADFQNTLDLVAEVRFSFIFSFKYSPRKHTPAARYLDQVPEDVKDERLKRLNALQEQITIAQNEAEIGHVRPVLFLYESRKHPGQFYGRTEHFRLVRVEAPSSLVGETRDVLITQANKIALLGELVTKM
jgi:tRNA-2-methylthio-N6-dimethylallyladenosine synthase